jgi:hypothetical protein
MKLLILTITLAIFTMLSCAQAASCQMERLNKPVVDPNIGSYSEICIYSECKEKYEHNNKVEYVTRYKNSITYFADICAALQKDMNNSKLQKEFFLYFPSNFYMFNSFFGYDMVKDETTDEIKKIRAPLYYKDNCVELFFKLNTIQKECVYEKAINIVQDAFLRDDTGLAELQLYSYDYDMIWKDLNRFISVLSKRSEKEQRDFWRWRFRLYDAPSKLPEGLEKIKTINKRSYDIMIDELKKAQADDVH